MLVRFSSTRTESIIMFSDSAAQLIKMMGSSGAIPGAVSAEDIPAALTSLRQQLQSQAAPPVAPTDADHEDEDKDRQPQIMLATRAQPLIELLERASAGRAPVMWEAL